MSKSYLRSGSLKPIVRAFCYEIWDTAQCAEGAITTWQNIIGLETSPAEHQGQRRSEESKQLQTCRRQEAASATGGVQGL